MIKNNNVHQTVNWSDYLKSGNRIFIGSHAAVPNALIEDLIANSSTLHDIEVVHIFTLSNNVWAEPKHQEDRKSVV
jgi:hypothetical protein